MTDDDTEWDLLMEMSDAELAKEEAALDREIAEHERLLAAMPIARQVAYHRRYVLESIRENRRRLRTPALCEVGVIVDLWRQGLARSRLRLLKLRVWRSTGVYPGEG